MLIKLFTDNIDEYLKEDDVIDYSNKIITQLADALYQESDSEVEYIKKAYEFVRDNVSHSADICLLSTALSPVCASKKQPVPYVFLASPSSKQV